MVPHEKLLEELLHVNVRNVVVLSYLLGVERLASTGWAHDQDFDWSEIALFCKFGFDEVDLFRETRLAQPIHFY